MTRMNMGLFISNMQNRFCHPDGKRYNGSDRLIPFVNTFIEDAESEGYTLMYGIDTVGTKSYAWSGRIHDDIAGDIEYVFSSSDAVAPFCDENDINTVVAVGNFTGGKQHLPAIQDAHRPEHAWTVVQDMTETFK